MINAIINMALLNLLGGRDVLGENSPNDRLIFRCLLMGIIPPVYMYEHGYDLATAAYVWLAATAGSAFWFPWGWSFDEITGKYDALKYPRWIKAIGISIVPLSDRVSRNRLRGIIMKGLRGSYDLLTFSLLAAVNIYAPLWWLGTFLMGLIYHITIYVAPQRYAVSLGEVLYGAWRAFLILKAMGV